MMEGVLLIAILARGWKFRLVPGQTVELWPQMTLRPRHSIQFELEEAQPVAPADCSPLDPYVLCPGVDLS